MKRAGARYSFGVPSRARVRALALVAAWAILGVAAPALADPIVVVYVRRQGTQVADAEVILRDADGVIGTCRTTGGTCEIRGVPPGRATVSARDAQGNETPGRPVMIPPDGRVSLFVAVP